MRIMDNRKNNGQPQPPFLLITEINESHPPIVARVFKDQEEDGIRFHIADIGSGEIIAGPFISIDESLRHVEMYYFKYEIIDPTRIALTLY